MSQTIDKVSELEASLSLERSRLVGLCARITGDVDIAEDLAQETLLEAWRHQQICGTRNVCRNGFRALRVTSACAGIPKGIATRPTQFLLC